MGVFVQIIPEAKKRRLQPALDAYGPRNTMTSELEVGRRLSRYESVPEDHRVRSPMTDAR
jgi:hypothetical protein